MVRSFIFLAVLLCLAVGCDKEGVGNYTLKNAKPGWTAAAVTNLIACEPAQSKKCVCVVEKITNKYTPDQVKEKSPLVAADIISAQVQCDGSQVSKNPVSIETPKPPKGTGGGTNPACPHAGPCTN